MCLCRTGVVFWWFFFRSFFFFFLTLMVFILSLQYRQFLQCRLIFCLSGISPGYLPETHQGWSLAWRVCGGLQEAVPIHGVCLWGSLEGGKPCSSHCLDQSPTPSQGYLSETHFVSFEVSPAALAWFQTARRQLTKELAVYAIDSYCNSTLLIFSLLAII